MHQIQEQHQRGTVITRIPKEGKDLTVFIIQASVAIKHR